MQTNGTKARLFVKIWFTEEPPSRSGIEHANREHKRMKMKIKQIKINNKI
jgi:hypothetical protein